MDEQERPESGAAEPGEEGESTEGKDEVEGLGGRWGEPEEN